MSIRRLYGFRRQRRYKKWRPKGRHTFPAERCYIPPEGGALNPPVRRSRSQAEPWQPRAERPGGWLNPHARKGVSTFGNTGKHRPGPSPDPDRATGAHFHPLNPGHPVAPWAIPQPLRPQGPSNLRTLRPIGPVKLKNLFPQPFYTTHGGAVPLRAQQARRSSRLGQYQENKPCQEEEDIRRQAVVGVEGILLPLHFLVGAGMEIFIMAFRNETFIKF